MKLNKGILIGVCNEQEWMLPWWFFHLRKHNSYPVCFADFGMSEKGKEWVKQRGDYLYLNIDTGFVKSKKEVDPACRDIWEMDIKGDFWPYRKKWFLKPFAMMKSPFKQTLWLDNDCEVRCDLTEIFNQMQDLEKIVIAKDLKSLSSDDSFITYNSGVVGFHPASCLISEWVEICITKNGQFLGDQDAFSYLLNKNKEKVIELQHNYNFFPHVYDAENNLLQKLEGNEKIIHWGGSVGKNNILKNIQSMPQVSFYDFKELF